MHDASRNDLNLVVENKYALKLFLALNIDIIEPNKEYFMHSNILKKIKVQ